MLKVDLYTSFDYMAHSTVTRYTRYRLVDARTGSILRLLFCVKRSYLNYFVSTPIIVSFEVHQSMSRTWFDVGGDVRF